MSRVDEADQTGQGAHPLGHEPAVERHPDRHERVTAFVAGRVQGVGFRWWTRARALELGLAGHARNLDDGRVEVLAQGPTAAVDRLVELLREHPSTAHRPGRVASVVTQFAQPLEGLRGFAER